MLLSQVEYILTHEQRPEDYNPENECLADLKPTKVKWYMWSFHRFTDNRIRRVEMLSNVYAPIRLCSMALQRNRLWISSLVKLVVVLESEYFYKRSRHQLLYWNMIKRVLSKHLKAQTVNEQGGFQYIRYVYELHLIHVLIPVPQWYERVLQFYHHFATELNNALFFRSEITRQHLHHLVSTWYQECYPWSWEIPRLDEDRRPTWICRMSKRLAYD